MKKSKLIRNGSAYSLTQKNAVLNEWNTTTKPAKAIGAEYNVSEATVRAWAYANGLQRQVHPNVQAYLNARAAKAAADKAFNTPIRNDDGSITFQGRTYH